MNEKELAETLKEMQETLATLAESIDHVYAQQIKILKFVQKYLLKE